MAAASIDHYVGIDRDAAALAVARDALTPVAAATGTRLTLLHGNFADAAALLASAGVPPVDGLLLDYGVSSMQLDTPDRGFSFLRDGPLDMRMDAAATGPTAADIVNGWSEAHLGAALRELGEERHWRGIAASIVAARDAAAAAGRGGLTTTAELAAAVAGGRRLNERRVHPATLTFQALRMVVNAEAAAVAALPRVLGALAPGGVAAVISFHSLEDRVVKRVFRDAGARGKVLGGGGRGGRGVTGGRVGVAGWGGRGEGARRRRRWGWWWRRRRRWGRAPHGGADQAPARRLGGRGEAQPAVAVGQTPRRPVARAGRGRARQGQQVPAVRGGGGSAGEGVRAGGTGGGRVVVCGLSLKVGEQ
ncbi:hypothetical protein BU14_0130s0015 [Porphyra umbilicalis]|uniref:Uncharacterized protein n=1 Tax=Porphyra umbilicalis TaxID=2786 RepID=A0A1X6PAS7_PORUM|nr:hypothetical protein BU14_0130s0015 [Porphyra umbilicalis]|eukprot:OSX77860.1 hypothetical protein BU14_0130s0015 [Porphyra umbilicalis]